MPVRHLRANIFSTRCQVIVNTVNCEGVMGAGLALEFRLRYPAMYAKYAELCAAGGIRPGLLWLYRAADRLILNFPTKDRWRLPSRPEYLHAGLRKFTATYRERGIRSIAFPILGADKGGIDKSVSLAIMQEHLEPLRDIDVDIYEYAPDAHDDLYLDIRRVVLDMPAAQVAAQTGISAARIDTIRAAMAGGDVFQVSQLGKLRGIGPDTLTRLFAIRSASPRQGGFDL